MARQHRGTALLLALFVACSALSTAAAAPAAKRPPPSELSNSFIITALQDLEPATIRGTEGITPCEYAVKRAKGLGQRHFSLVVTAYWKGGPHGVQGYGFKDVSPRYFEGYGFPDPTPAGVEAWKRGLQRCFKAAVAAGFTGLQVLNHIDAHDGSTWRNLLDFDPLAKYNGWSYEDVVVRPAAEALRAVVKPTTKVWFMVSGEMGRSVFGHPTSYLKLISKYRGALAERRAPGATKVGVALHWNKVCGNCFEMPRADTAAQYNATYAAVFARDRAAILPRFDLPMVRRVLEVSDVVGLSHYAPAPERGVAPGDFNAPIDTAAFELSFFGISLPDLIHKGGREFIFSEVGLGGADPSNARVASNLRELATNVHNGIWTVYNAAQDPWARADYRGFRREWFRALTAFLYRGGGPRYRVDAAFVWSVGTWDVAAVHPISTSLEGTYADWEVVKWMRWLSAQAAAAGGRKRAAEV